MKTESVTVTLVNGAVQEFPNCWLLEAKQTEYVLSLEGDKEVRIPMTSVLFVEEQKGWG
ncbi:hypothetical protein PP460_gp029 [Streptomyces phage Muntaha]|uniref:Uncharacterized protein n=1 Tax=Streptomyces phage Muntaha TaxID=2713269 RepID=A0A6G8R3L9_9CAUD|nr:hypothetical protein PP460_gp029 [Streptomyces phage Muntaha]QIN94773.1 hypothetical protein SEA_MUNTAHA_250 [Streptomyces phage Muntaha]